MLFYLRIWSPPYEVVGLSDELGADLIVVGSGRPRAVRRAALGAAADYTVRSDHCPSWSCAAMGYCAASSLTPMRRPHRRALSRQ
jgi:hypothetical protein